MTVVHRRRQAQDDIQLAADYYFREGGAKLELRFIGAVEAAIQHVAAHPASGSPRYADSLSTPGLRCRPVKGFPYLVFYIERVAQVDVWRVLHKQRDIPAWMQDREQGS
ncbi:MAG: type II toxin-antitoxin system RelE/ParE family toxin [Nitrococcus sp.]|nr:type II toxin-antitoxin system RelE/ParE family toxin [Nitrococcus sp.]